MALTGYLTGLHGLPGRLPVHFTPASRGRRLTYSCAWCYKQRTVLRLNHVYYWLLTHLDTVTFIACWLWLLTFVHNLRKEQHIVSGLLSSSELVKAQQHLIKGTQGMTYHEELSYLLKRQSKCPPLIRQLRLFLDNDKLIHCGGIIHNAPTTELAKFPVLLPVNSWFIGLIIMDTHLKLHHGGVSITVTALSRILSLQQCVRKLLRRCVTCNKLKGRAPDPPPLPEVWVTESPLFTVTGVDFSGALYVKEQGKWNKGVHLYFHMCCHSGSTHWSGQWPNCANLSVSLLEIL